MNFPRQQTHCKGQTGTWPSKGVKKEQKVHQEVLVCLSTPPSPALAALAIWERKRAVVRRAPALTLTRGEGIAAASLTAATAHGNSFPSRKETPWQYPAFFLGFLKSRKLKTDQRAYLSTLEVICCCSAQLSLTEPPKEKESKSHTVIRHAESQASISDVPGITTCLKMRSSIA